MTCKDFENLIVEAIYGELNNDMLAELIKHKEHCKTCASLYEGMLKTVNIMKNREHPEIDPTFSSELWSRIEPNLTEEKSGNIKKIFLLRPVTVPSWAYGIAALILIAAGIYLGQIYFTSPSKFQSEPTSVSASNFSDSDTTITNVYTYLQRSKNFLLSIVNTDKEGKLMIDPRRQVEFSQKLIDEGEALYTVLNRPDQQQLRRLIDDLRVILLQLANVEIKPGEPVLEIVRNSIDKKSIILKINIEALRAMSGETKQNKNLKDKNI